MDWNFIINRLGEEESGPVSPPVCQTSNFRFAGFRELENALLDEQHSRIYSRGNNPTLELLSQKLAALEGADHAMLFASGMAAISTAIISVLKQGDHVVCVQHPYSWTRTLLTSLLARFGISVSYASEDALLTAVEQNTKLVYIESPSSYTFNIVDLESVATFCRSRGITTIIDNSYSSPLLQQPMKHGIDIVVHSATKYIGGHSDTVGGVLLCNSEWYGRIFNQEYLTLGGIMSPMNAWLMLRGLRTLPIRMERVQQSAEKVIEYLKTQSAISYVHFPGSSSAKQKEVAAKQMRGMSGLFSFEFKNFEKPHIEKFCNSLQLFQIAVSWGGYESLVLPAAALPNTQLSLGLVRLSIGLEDGESLISDLDQAIRSAFN